MNLGLLELYIGEFNTEKIPVSSGNTERQLMLMQDLGSTILVSTPAYALYMADVAEKIGVDMDKIKLRLAMFGGEGHTEEMRRQIEKRWHLLATENYGLSEIGGPRTVTTASPSPPPKKSRASTAAAMSPSPRKISAFLIITYRAFLSSIEAHISPQIHRLPGWCCPSAGYPHLFQLRAQPREQPPLNFDGIAAVFCFYEYFPHTFLRLQRLSHQLGNLFHLFHHAVELVGRQGLLPIRKGLGRGH